VYVGTFVICRTTDMWKPKSVTLRRPGPLLAAGMTKYRKGPQRSITQGLLVKCGTAECGMRKVNAEWKLWKDSVERWVKCVMRKFAYVGDRLSI